MSVVEDKEPDSPGGNSSIEVKVGGSLEDPAVISQMLAQVIVFSFTEKKKHPEFKNFLIPTIGINRSNIIFYFYDSEHDILLKSPTIPLLVHGEISVLCVLATWLVVNYKFLCTGVPQNMLDDVKKANFFHMAESFLSVYQNELSIGTGIRCNYRLENHYDPSLLTFCHFVNEPEKESKSIKDS